TSHTTKWLCGDFIIHVCVVFSQSRPSADAAPGRVSPARASGEWTHCVRPLQCWCGPLYCSCVWLAPLRAGLEPEEGTVLSHGQEAGCVH
uniref:Uncharacterized protein n=1 Tax=Castor canadensis TaxID=51338 RepID=A0A8C0X6D6_CASCN